MNSSITFEIYPNPSAGIFTLRLADSYSDLTKFHVDVIDLLGKVAFENKLIIDNVVQIDVSDLKKGIYAVRVYDDEGRSEVKKIVLQ